MFKHLCYCTNIHPTETWAETLDALKTHTLQVRDKILATTRDHASAYPIGLRLSATAATQLLEDENLSNFKYWLYTNKLYVFTINGFPYGTFHNTRVKEQVYAPDWTNIERLSYTADLITIVADLAPQSLGGSVSTLPGSFKEFAADENLIFAHLYATAKLLESMSEETGKDLHLGLEPEPLGHFENSEETIAFFDRFAAWAEAKNFPTDIIYQHIGINYDTCHFALQYEDAATALKTLTDAGLRISKIHLSNALELKLTDDNSLEKIKKFNEPTYLHQVIIKDDSGKITRFKDIENALANTTHQAPSTARIHFHIPLHAAPKAPFTSTIQHTIDTLNYLKVNPSTCQHLEMETYTWGVLPDDLQIPIDDQLTQEHLWVLEQ